MVPKERLIKYLPWGIAVLAVGWMLLSAVSWRTWSRETSPTLEKEDRMIRRIDSLAGAFGRMMEEANESRENSIRFQKDAIKLMTKKREEYENESHSVVDSAGFDSLVHMFFADPYGVSPERRSDTDSTADQ